jgi:hypothetical protein
MKGHGNGIPRLVTLTLALLGCMTFAATAGATTRYAAPGGTAADTICVTPDAPKCSIGAAAGGPDVLAADEAVILPGTYSETAGDLGGDTGSLPTTVEPLAGTIHGAPGAARPVIVLDSTVASPNNNFFGAFFVGASTLTDVEIDTGPGSTAASDVSQSLGSTVDRVIARSDVPNAITCNQSQGTIRDSACFSGGNGGSALGASTFIGGTFTVNLRNVTAIATGTGSSGVFYFYATSSPPVGPTITVSAKSLIAQGAAQDIRVRALGTGTIVNMNLDHSDYDSAIDEDVSGGAASVTAPGTGTGNITATPMLAADGYHELAGSQTVNTGATDGSSGSLDTDGQSRTIGGTADIGADELAFPTTTAVSCTPNPLLFGSGSAQCAVTVTDTTSPPPVTFLSGVRLTSDQPGSFVANCETLFMATPTQGTCAAPYTPTAVGSHRITAVYAGDANHDSSQDTDVLDVTQPTVPTGPGPALSPPQAAKKKCKKKKHKRSAVTAKKKCKKKK